MMVNFKRAIALLVLVWFFGSSVAFAQTATVVRNVNLRDDPSTDHTPIRLLNPPEVLTLLSDEEEDGYFNVRTAAGEEGSVWANNVKIDPAAPPLPSPTAAIATVFSPTWPKPPPNKSTFTGVSGTCDFDGIGTESASNHRKNRTDLPQTFTT